MNKILYSVFISWCCRPVLQGFFVLHSSSSSPLSSRLALKHPAINTRTYIADHHFILHRIRSKREVMYCEGEEIRRRLYFLMNDVPKISCSYLFFLQFSKFDKIKLARGASSIVETTIVPTILVNPRAGRRGNGTHTSVYVCRRADGRCQALAGRISVRQSPRCRFFSSSQR